MRAGDPAVTAAAEISADVLHRAARRVLRLLGRYAADADLPTVGGGFHVGDPPIAADLAAHAAFAEELLSDPAASELAITAVVGEEHSHAPDPVPPGGRVVVVDPLDGSWGWATLRSGYCVAALVLVANAAAELAVESAVVAAPTDTFRLTGDLTVGPTFARTESYRRVDRVVPERPRATPSLAVAGYRVSDRPAVAELFDRLDDWSIVTLGGNPATPYVVTGGLTAALTLGPQCTWDAIGLLMAATAGAVIGTAQGRIMSATDVRRRLATVRLTANARVVPPLIVAKNRTRYAELVDRLGAERLPRPVPRSPAGGTMHDW
jgi:3'-phosphoadenosine 5'-phosphosulfate (PAPS) 3'-phosphatase